MSTDLLDDEFPNQLSSVDNKFAQELRQCNNLWRSNYHEAAIFIEEGLNNDKFENHPRKRDTSASSKSQDSLAPPQLYQANTSELPATPLEQADLTSDVGKRGVQSHNHLLDGSQYTTIETYILVHNRYFYQLDLAASVVLLFLALFEPPAIEGYELNSDAHAAIEMFALGIIAVELLLKFRWMGPRRFFRHGRTVIKLVVLLTMNIEAVVILVRHATHARYTRALRPIFLIDNHYCHGIRRAIRQIFQSLPPIIDMFTLALFFMFVFSIFGFYLFASSNSYFSDMPATVGNLLIMATTANLPDIMMPSYAITRWSAIFFVLFIIIHLFLLTNLTMAAVYESFTRKEKEKFHKLLLHRRKACQKAFKLLVTRREPDRLHYRQFMGLMRYLNRKCSMFDAYLIFKALDSDKSGSISLEEFYQIYDHINLDWKLIYPEIRWYDEYSWIPGWMRYALDIVGLVVRQKYFEWTIDILIAIEAILQFTEATALNLDGYGHQIKSTDETLGPTTHRPDSISTLTFITIFSVEAILRCLASGFQDYWSSRWNRFDLLVLLVSIAGLIAGYFGIYPFGWVIVLRALRLTRLFEFKRRYKDMWQTLTYILMKRFVSMTCVVMILYYFFAILGMEILGDYDLKNCCKNTSVESQFKYDNSTENPRYYLNDFGDIVASYLTLFSMTSNTYWLTTMTAYAIVSGTNWTRLFFGIYYLCSIIVMNIVIAFILESFLFRIHYRSKMGNNCDDTNLFTVRVALSSSEVDFLRKNLARTYANSSFRGEKSSFARGEPLVIRKDKNLAQMIKILERKQLIATSESVCDERLALDEEGIGLISGQKQPFGKRYRFSPNLASHQSLMEQGERTSGDETSGDRSSSGSIRRKPQVKSSKGEPLLGPDKRWYLIYQAEQIRNKFSFTMKMYADEVEGWLAEAERADRDEMSAMISRNQIRAEHVAMARLVRRSLAEQNNESLLDWPRPRSWSSSGPRRFNLRAPGEVI